MAILPTGSPGFPGGVEVRIRQPWGQLTIDATPSREAIGLKDPSVFAEEAGAAGKQALLGYIAKSAAETDQWLRIENPGDPAVAIGKSFLDNRASEVTLTSTKLPIIHYTRQSPDLQWVLTSGGTPIGRLIDRMA
ncbi:DUF6470 family protein [Heliophilum fasciatum]|uniref:Uncharacterized protein n=1 Tax=Heliophilum fasciatum TaxID=35700 RepID=A0A4R2RYB1_9FIRM|nr:DUF6470 family protein [Heliophilum fasciatum]MCW2278819.1 hypothetical protein [Heliophilum fasciatum]TCP64095.1 hypothetical protein EDD73_11256 [Heliophilum fasciatum]